MADMETHEENLERVEVRIGPAILHFFRDRLKCPNRQYHADELRNWVTRATGINAPASSDRVMRDLRKKKQLGYKLVSRRQSLYEVKWVDQPPGTQMDLEF